MGVARFVLGATAFGVALSFTGCGQEEGPLFEEQTLEFKTTVPGTVLEVIDNGCLADPYIIYRVYPAEDWSFISTPAMIDSVFEEGRSLLEPYFPEGGSLLCFDLSIPGEDVLLGYSVELSGDTVRVLAVINQYKGSGLPSIPGYNRYFFPFGVTLQPTAPPER